jgi:hypothetical protein
MRVQDVCIDFATVGRRPYIYRTYLTYGQLILHQGWDHQHSQPTCVVRLKSLGGSISTSLTTVFRQYVRWNFMRLSHRPHILLARVSGRDYRKILQTHLRRLLENVVAMFLDIIHRLVFI